MTDSAQNMQSILAQLVRAQLPRDAMREAFTFLLSGKASPEQIGGFICALATRGEAVDDVIAGVSVLLEHASLITAPESALDIVGTGGDGIGTWNISTAAALVVAGGGVSCGETWQCGGVVQKRGGGNPDPMRRQFGCRFAPCASGDG